ncbi:MAG: hypothetical protein ACSLEM_00700 [Candidatus Malihini olakiniferum]
MPGWPQALLVTLGTSVAYMFSLFTLLTTQYDFETSAAIITLMLLGKSLKSREKTKTSAAIKATHETAHRPL